MMHDAQIRAIIPITVQIIVRELVAAKRVASAETQPKRHMLGSEPQRHGFESISAGRGEAAGSKRISVVISGSKLLEPREAGAAFETGVSTWQLRFDLSADNAAVSPRCDLDVDVVSDTGDDNGIVVAAALMATSSRLCSPCQGIDTEGDTNVCFAATNTCVWIGQTLRHAAVSECKINFRSIVERRI